MKRQTIDKFCLVFTIYVNYLIVKYDNKPCFNLYKMVLNNFNITFFHVDQFRATQWEHCAYFGKA